MDTPAVNQVDEKQSPQQTNKGGVNVTVVVIIIFVLALVLSAGAYFLLRSSRTGQQQNNQNTLNPSQSPNTPTQQVAVFKDGELSFSYDASWKQISSKALFKLQFDSTEPATALDITYFFSPANWRRAQGAMISLKDDVKLDATGSLPMAAAVDTLIPLMDVDVHRRANWTAEAFALESTKGICRGTAIVSYDKESEPDRSKIKEIVVAGKKAYLEPPQSTCEIKFLSIFIDSPRKNAEGKPESFQIIFNNAMDLDHLSPEQQIIFDSIKVE